MVALNLKRYSAPVNSPLTHPEGPIVIQDHDNPVVFRNIWVVPQ